MELRNLLSVELVELSLAFMLAPQTQDLRLGAVGHVDELLKPPPFTDSTSYTAEYQAVVTHLDNNNNNNNNNVHR